jgi:CRISPR-associated protein Cmr6
MEYLVPNQTRNALTHYEGRCRNMGLVLSRYIPGEVIRNDTHPSGRYTKWQDVWFKGQVSQYGPGDNGELAKLIEANVKRWLELAERSLHFKATTTSRMAIGLGTNTVLENGLTLHHVTGLPYIPGSALKGLARAYALYFIADKFGVPTIQEGEANVLSQLENVLELPLDSEARGKAFDKLDEILTLAGRKPLDRRHLDEFLMKQPFHLAFGSQEAAGVVVFHDAVVAGIPKDGLYDVDVMTPHFPEYYSSQGATPPADNQNPIPIQYLTVAKEVTFHFAVGLRSSLDEGLEVAQSFAHAALKRGLRELGVGSKTNAGYGYFRIHKD